MVVLAYVIAWFQANFLLGFGLGLALLALWGVLSNRKRPAAVRRLRFIPLVLLIPFLASVGLFLTDKLKFTDNLRGRTVAAYGQDATVTVGANTGSYATRRNASLYYDVTIRYADGTTKTDNLDLLGVLRTNNNWWGQLVDQSRTGRPTVLTVKYLPGLKDGWVVTGIQSS
ncbi:hypothetical protein [Enemella evansiae]|uniref:Uncharacterized protein n=1 Tax=Enemella evansiae TaxID=2016499 RepID=A0A255G1A5_9ACTN|nr:hypothetical protein [Enemella evansiae]OYN93537.1 hypothetical protein CGZ95_19575 [Enemella evansiae]OYN93720.1 hypothetical protein CGZ96_20165 [Enemella evansiae]OYO05798.1 hypothetical protein CGZ97_03635 [Enemella evansiae]OYO09709.1 hypothetical protein CGZ94_18850 [Enemella evansiae]OYO15055.1 hypothetical protein CGZ98_01005 [Enemella evansiae]